MTTIPALVAIVLGTMPAGETINREGTFALSHGQGYRRETHTGPAWGFTYIGPQWGVGNVTLGYDSIADGAFTLGWRIEQPLTGQWSWATDFGLAHVIGGQEVFGSDTLFSLSASLIYQVNERTAVFAEYEHKSHAWLFGDKNPGSNAVSIGIMMEF